MTTTVSLTIRPLTSAIGAEVEGVDLREPLDDAAIAAVRAALLDHLVLFFPDQDISPTDQVRFARYWGEPMKSTGTRTTDNIEGVGVIDQVAPVGHGTDAWHSDHLFMPEPPMGTLLRSVQLPSVGGDTCFASMYAAYDALSPAMKAFLEPLTSWNSPAKVVARVKSKGVYANDIEREMPAPTRHPVVRVHPETGRKALFVCSGFTHRIDELEEHESDAVLQMLFKHIESPFFQVRYRWRTNCLAFWDNRVTQHLAVPDYSERRVMHRTMIGGGGPVHGPNA
jgi:taurine dioxygenase